MSNLLARYGEEVFWLGRHIERIENLARIIDINETFSRDSRGAQDWMLVLRIFSDEERFAELHGTPTSTDVLRFYLTDRDNPGSLVSMVRAARENARTLRPLISTEMWEHLNRFNGRIRELAEQDIRVERLDRLTAEIKEACQAHIGITDGTFYRDESWCFYEMGRMIERADQTTRLLDVKYHALLPQIADVGSPLDVAQWNAVLRSAAGYHAYRRVHPRGMSPARVAGFLLFDPWFPRSVRRCIGRIDDMLERLNAEFEVSPSPETDERLDDLRAVVDNETIDNVIAMGLHEFSDRIQMELIALANAVRSDYFARDEDAA